MKAVMAERRTEATCKSLGAWILAIPALARRLTLLRTGVGFGLSTSISTFAKNSSAESRTSKKKKKIHSFSSETRELFNSKCHQQSHTVPLGAIRTFRQEDF